MTTLPSGLKTFEANDTVRRIAQNENIEATDALFHETKGHRHTGKAGDAPRIGGEGIAVGAIERKHLRASGSTANIAKFKRVWINGGSLFGLPTTPWYGGAESQGDRNSWTIDDSRLPNVITIDLGYSYSKVEGMSFVSIGDSMPRGFYIEVSNDQESWTRVYTHEGPVYESAAFLEFRPFESCRYLRLVVTSPSHKTYTAVAGLCVYSGDNGNEDLDVLEDRRTWGLSARLQGLMIIPEGQVKDYGDGSLGIYKALMIMNPSAGTYFRVNGGTYKLPAWGYLYIDIEHIHKQSVFPKIGTWTEGPRAYEHKDRIVLAQRNGDGDIYLHSAIQAKIAGNIPDADKVDGIDMRTSSGYLEYNDGSGWKGVGIKSVQRGTVNLSFFYPNQNSTLFREVTITPVNPQKTFLQVFSTGLAVSMQSNPVMDGSICARLIGSNKVRFNALESFYEAYAEIAWEVIEYA
ncbi:discoidin domain-containing protein [Gorillibacterium timonense]|uniref:discoidin domain-containing protein n=1 Tax=Gorillibacterium timonense TaxID=1689269 RepID=UPI00071DFA59|nr:discoidin domain-containing protein [Gorillibacterium timonense]